nr:DNA alkylation repair protein [Bacteroides coprosuis]
MNFNSLLKQYQAVQDKERAAQMEKYMRNQFSFLGIATPERRKIAKPLFQEAKYHEVVDWCLIQKCWDCPYRELQYVACDYLHRVTPLLVSKDLESIEKLITTKSWWDSVDSLYIVIASMVQADPRLKKRMRAWSLDDNKWLRRAAIAYQLSLKEETDLELLSEVILNNTNHPDFFVQKAIGWILREYSKTDSDWVRSFINQHGDAMSKLSIREGSKYI